MENVTGILSMDSGRVKEAIFKAFKAIGYSIDARVLNAVDYGVPQNRKRAIFIGKLVGGINGMQVGESAVRMRFPLWPF